MALDKMVDSTQLDSDLGDVADAIRAKSGGSSQLAFPLGFISEIGSIQTGGGGAGLEQYAVSIVFGKTGGNTLPENFTVNAPNVTSLGNMFKGVKGVKNIIINTGGITSMNETFSQNVTGIASGERIIQEINIITSTKQCTNYYAAFMYNANLERIIGVIDFTAASANSSYAYALNSMFSGCSKLKHVSFAPNTLARDATAANLENTIFDQETLISLANCLVSGSYTIKLSNAQKTTIQSITGSVSSVTDDSGTYDFFTADENGAVTLANFITNTKGWTIT